jgi:microcystin-dependent protein
LCNGSNSTPDLRDKFVVGAGSSYAVGATGGSANAIVVSHNHTATSTSTVTDPGHQHGEFISSLAMVSASGTGSSVSGGVVSASGATNNQVLTATQTTGVTVATTTTVASNGASGTNANLPPYYALCYIMKT